MSSMHVNVLALLVRDVSYTVAIGWRGGMCGVSAVSEFYCLIPLLAFVFGFPLLSLPLHSGSLIPLFLSYLAELRV